MRFDDYILEWQVKYGYAGRDVAAGMSPIIWIYLTSPGVGLIWNDPQGNVYHLDKKVGKLGKTASIATHKSLLAAAWDKLGFAHPTVNMRKSIDDIVDAQMEKNVRGRIVGDIIYLYSGYDKKLLDRAVDAIYKWVPEKEE